MPIGSSAVLLLLAASPTARGPDPFGVGASLSRHLEESPMLSTGEFKSQFLPKGTLKTLPFDAKEAKYLDTFLNARTSGGPDRGASLDQDEKRVLLQNGFMVSGRRPFQSFVDAYADIWRHDQPVYITADSVMHAWHRTYDQVLEQVERDSLIDTLDGLLKAAAGGVVAEKKHVESSASFGTAVDDADVFFTVARSLLKGEPVKAALGAKNDARVNTVLRAAKTERTLELELFGRHRVIDFSQFKPRGHYTNSPSLQRYFRAMMWCGRIDLEIAGPGGVERELAGALVIEEVLQKTGQLEAWRGIDTLLEGFVGRVDSLTPGDVAVLLTVSSVDDLASANLGQLRQRIENATLGAQAINSGHREHDPLQPDLVELPRAFTLFGQRFTLDGWALGEVVYDRVHLAGQAQRLMPTGLDVAFSVFANDGAAPHIAEAIEKSGLPYQRNVVAVRAVIDERPTASWDESLYTQWLSALRALSTSSDSAPAVTKTQAWRERVLTAQLGSWAELRHDTILTAKQTEGFSVGCVYPTGYVEPSPDLWGRLEAAARHAEALVGKAPFRVAARAHQRRFAAHFKRFADTMHRLADIAAQELKQQPLAAADLQFLKNTTVVGAKGEGCDEVVTYNGWYPSLFLNGADDGLLADPLVADVYTHPEAGVLHEATGAIDTMVALIDSGPDLMAFAGPVFSQYELVKPPDTRLTDNQWRRELHSRTPPARPSWVRAWHVH